MDGCTDGVNRIHSSAHGWMHGGTDEVMWGTEYHMLSATSIQSTSMECTTLLLLLPTPLPLCTTLLSAVVVCRGDEGS